MSTPLIVKVGGSLYDLPDLGARLTEYLHVADASRVILIPGGGPAANVIRSYSKTHHLDEETCHWLALRMLTVNAHFLARLLPKGVVGADPAESGLLLIMDMYTFAQQDDARPGCLPHSWDVTSDSLAVRVAAVAGAKELVLLKSIAWEGPTWPEAARAGVVDGFFPNVLRSAPGLVVRVVRFR